MPRPKTIRFEIELPVPKSCGWCPFVSCGHFGEDLDCEAGFGAIRSDHEHKKVPERYLWIRPKACIKFFKGRQKVKQISAKVEEQDDG